MKLVYLEQFLQLFQIKTRTKTHFVKDVKKKSILNVYGKWQELKVKKTFEITLDSYWFKYLSFNLRQLVIL